MKVLKNKSIEKKKNLISFYVGALNRQRFPRLKGIACPGRLSLAFGKLHFRIHYERTEFGDVCIILVMFIACVEKPTTAGAKDQGRG